MKRMLCVSLVFIMLVCGGCNVQTTNNYTNKQTESTDVDKNKDNSDKQKKGDKEAEEQAKKEAEEQAKREAEEQAKREAEEKARKEAEEKAKNEAKKTVEGFMDSFLVLDLKGMASYTDADINYTEMKYLSLDEYKRDMLSKFTVFESMGLPIDGFKDIVDKVFSSFEKYSDYKITGMEMSGQDVKVNVNVEFIRAETMENIIDNAINRVNTDDLKLKVAGALVVGGISKKSVKGAVEAALAPVVESLDMAVSRSIEELKPEKCKLTFVVSEIDYDWIIRDELSDYSGLSKVFERTQKAE